MRTFIVFLAIGFFSLKILMQPSEKRQTPRAVLGLIEEYKKRDIRFPYVALAQSVHETGWFSSAIYRENGNRFGMKYNGRGYAKKKARGHAYYPNPGDSLEDYAAWQARCLKLRPDIDTEEEYIHMLDNLPICKDCRYAEDLTYTDRIRENVRLLKQLAEE